MEEFRISDLVFSDAQHEMLIKKKGILMDLQIKNGFLLFFCDKNIQTVKFTHLHRKRSSKNGDADFFLQVTTISFSLICFCNRLNRYYGRVEGVQLTLSFGGV